VLETVRSVLQRLLAAHPTSASPPAQPGGTQGFYPRGRPSAGRDLLWEMDDLPDVRDAIQGLADDKLAVLADALAALLPDPALWYGYLERL
jgi:hypothetical protein